MWCVQTLKIPNFHFNIVMMTTVSCKPPHTTNAFVRYYLNEYLKFTESQTAFIARFARTPFEGTTLTGSGLRDSALPQPEMGLHRGASDCAAGGGGDGPVEPHQTHVRPPVQVLRRREQPR